MKESNVIYDKSFYFAIRIVNLFKYLKDERKEFIISKQVMRSGTSIGANVSEAIEGSKRNKISDKIVDCNRIYG